jgi:hypothetical protein
MSKARCFRLRFGYPKSCSNSGTLESSQANKRDFEKVGGAALEFVVVPSPFVVRGGPK